MTLKWPDECTALVHHDSLCIKKPLRCFYVINLMNKTIRLFFDEFSYYNYSPATNHHRPYLQCFLIE